MFFKNTVKYWPEFYLEFRTWRIFSKTAKQYKDALNKDHNLRVDWLGRIYGVVNLTEEVQGASGEIQQAYVLQQITKYGKTLMNMGLGDIVYPEIQKIKGTAGYLVILWPAFEALQTLQIIWNTIKTSVLITGIVLLVKLTINNTGALVSAWNWALSLFN
ncbi:hypothetical protein OAB94_00650 [Flavobacteriaceae bacterium]|nr:hypothetical protein [Flavobacteriaceae bacterium]